MKKLSRIYCFFKGHDFLLEAKHDNGRSKFKDYVCMRCKKEHHNQYDYLTY